MVIIWTKNSSPFRRESSFRLFYHVNIVWMVYVVESESVDLESTDFPIPRSLSLNWLLYVCLAARSMLLLNTQRFELF